MVLTSYSSLAMLPTRTYRRRTQCACYKEKIEIEEGVSREMHEASCCIVEVISRASQFVGEQISD